MHRFRFFYTRPLPDPYSSALSSHSTSETSSNSQISRSMYKMVDMAEAKQFKMFSRLPVELRNMIWELALPGPRIVHLVQKAMPSKPGEHGQQLPKTGLASDAIPPQLLFVCKEAHAVATKFYTCAFSTDDAIPQTWFNFSIDTLYLHYLHFEQELSYDNWDFDFEYKVLEGIKWVNQDDFRKVEKLAVAFSPHRYPYDGNLEVLSKTFPNVKDVQVVEDHYQGLFDIDQSKLEFADYVSLEQPFKRFQKAQKDYIKKMFPEHRSHPTESLMDSRYYVQRPAPLLASLQEHDAYSRSLRPLGRPKMHWGIQNFHPTFIVSQGFVEALDEVSQIYESKIEEDIDIQKTLREYEFTEDYEKTEIELRDEWAMRPLHFSSCRYREEDMLSKLRELNSKADYKKTEDEVLFEHNNRNAWGANCHLRVCISSHPWCKSCRDAAPKCNCW